MLSKTFPLNSTQHIHAPVAAASISPSALDHQTESPFMHVFDLGSDWPSESSPIAVTASEKPRPSLVSLADPASSCKPMSSRSVISAT